MGRSRHRLPGRRRLSRHEHPGRAGAPPLPGATIADAAAGGMQAALAITTALAGRASTGQGAYLDVSVAEGVLWLMSLAIDEQLALGGDIEPGHDVLSGRYACYATYQASDGALAGGRGHRGPVLRQPVPGPGMPRARGLPVRGRRRSPTIRAAFARAFATRTRDEWVKLLAGADTCVAPVLEVAEVADDPQFRGPRRGGHGHPPHAAAPSRNWPRCWRGWFAPAAPTLPDMTVTDTEHLLKEAGVDGETVARWVERRVVA